MSCPPEVSEILLKIVRTGLLRVRSLAWSGQAECCAVEADHIHNLPDLVADFSRERLTYYWDVERTSYIASTPGEQRADWESLWQELRPHIEIANASAATYSH